MRYLCLLALCAMWLAWQLSSCGTLQYYVEDPGAQPRSEPRSEPRDKPRSEPRDKPRSEPRDEPAEPAPEDSTRRPPLGLLRVGTWNLRRLGHGDKRVDLVAALIDDSFDVVALQEVMDKQAVVSLLDLLPGWHAEISTEPVGRGQYKEFYAVLYRADYVVAERAFTVDDTDDELVREPFVACLRATDFDFCLVTVHIVFGDRTIERDQEIDALGHMVDGQRARGAEKDWIVVGDFNRQPGAPGWERMRTAGWHFTTDERMATSLGKTRYASAYDHILVDARHTRELVRAAVRIDLVATSCAGDFEMCRRQVSDHAPLVTSFQVDGGSDDD